MFTFLSAEYYWGLIKSIKICSSKQLSYLENESDPSQMYFHVLLQQEQALCVYQELFHQFFPLYQVMFLLMRALISTESKTRGGTN